MAGATELPEVVQNWTADVSDYVAAMAELIASTKEAANAVEDLQHTIDALHGKTVDIGIDTAAANAAAAVNDLSRAENDLADSTWKANAAGQFQMDTTRLLSETDDLLAGQEERLTTAYAARAAAARVIVTAMRGEAENASSLAVATGAAGDAVGASGAAAVRAAAAWTIFGVKWTTVAHWVIAGGAEILAVTIPAAVALGAGLLVASQGATNAYNHMVALWTAVESMGHTFGTTMGQTLGLGHALQTAQDQANPGVYEILGSVINDLKSKFADFAGTGLQVVHMLDEFSARITVDLQGALGGQLHGLLAEMVPDLQEIGQVFGNIGHAILSFAAAMPGLAAVLLKVADGVSRVILWVSQLPAGLITAAMALEEFYRWGGLAASIITRLSGLLAALPALGVAAAVGLFGRFAAVMGAVVGVGATLVGGLSQVIALFIGIVPGAEAASVAVGDFANGMRAAAADVVLMGTIGAALAALGVLAVVLMHVKDAAGQMASSAVKAVQAANDMQVLGVAAQKMQELGAASAKTETQLSQMSPTMVGVSAAFQSSAMGTNSFIAGLGGLGRMTAGMQANLRGVGAGLQATSSAAGGATGVILRLWSSFSGAASATDDMTKFNAASRQIMGIATNVGQNLNQLAGHFHVGAIAALEMANAAGVNLQLPLTHSAEAMKIMDQQVRNFLTGIGAMRAPAGVIGADMTALGIQSQLAGTKVQQLNQAMDQLMTNLTSGMAAWSQARLGMGQLAQEDVKLSGSSLKAAQGWQTFTGVVSQGETAIDTLRTGMAENVVSGNLFQNTVKAMVGSMLQFAHGSPAAVTMLSNLAHQAGGPVTSNLKTLANWLGITGQKAQTQFAKDMAKATVAMGQTGQVAKNLTAIIGNQLSAAMAQAINKASGVGQAIKKYAKDLSNAHTPSNVLKSDLAEIGTKYANEQRMAQQAGSAVDKSASATSRAASATTQHVSAVTKQASAVGRASAALAQQVGAVDRNIGPTGNLANKASDLGNKASTMGSHVATAGSHVATAGGQASTAAGKMSQLGTSQTRVDTTAHSATSAVNSLHSAIGNASSAAAGATGRMAQLSVSEGRVGTSAFQAAAAVRQLAAAIDSLHSKTVTVTTVTQSVKRAAGGGVVGVSLQHGGVIPGYSPGRDTVPAMLSPGEGVLTPQAVRMLGADWVHAVNTMSEHGTANPSALRHGMSGPTGGGGPVVVHAHLYVDGRELGTTMRQESYRWSTRSSGVRSGLNIPGTRVG